MNDDNSSDEEMADRVKKRQRVKKSTEKKTRRKSGWGVFRSHFYQEPRVKTLKDFGKKTKLASEEWKKMPESEKEAYKLEAAMRNDER